MKVNVAVAVRHTVGTQPDVGRKYTGRIRQMRDAFAKSFTDTPALFEYRIRIGRMGVRDKKAGGKLLVTVHLYCRDSTVRFDQPGCTCPGTHGPKLNGA